MNDISFRYEAGFELQVPRLIVEEGEMVALLGPNGSGKTTLLRLLARALRPNVGKVRLQGEPIADLTRRELARRIAVLPQEMRLPFAYTAREVAMLGRTAYFGLLGGVRAEDRSVVADVMSATGIASLSEREFGTLSGGERQRVILAMALSQQPKVLLLDEPTAFLDIGHRVEALELVASTQQRAGLTVVAAIHDLNLAAIHFPRLVLLDEGRIIADGPAEEVITQNLLEKVYRTSVTVVSHPVLGVPQVLTRRSAPVGAWAV